MMKCFSWGLLKRHVNITHLIAFSFGVIVICFLDALVFEKSIADWLSACANVVMAGAAFYAAYNAKDWFGQKINDIGIKQAEKIINTASDIIRTILLIRNNLFYLSPDNFDDKNVDKGFIKKHVEQNVLDLASNNELLMSYCTSFHYLTLTLSKFNFEINKTHSDTVKNYISAINKFSKQIKTFLLEYTNDESLRV